MIQLKEVMKTYKMGDEIIHALDGVDLLINKGEFLAIIGPSGSGKTTLANIIGGLDTPTAGNICVEQDNLKRASDNMLSEYRNKKVGFIFQSFNLQPAYTALENVMLPLILAKMPPKARKVRAEQCLSAVGLEKRMRHKPHQLSGGQRQRVSIARALANNPEVIIADEPTGNLDSTTGAEIMALLKELNQKQQITLIMITHNNEIARQADRVIVIKDGRIAGHDVACAARKEG